MRKQIISFAIGLILGTAVTAYAAAHVMLVSSNNIELGTASNPIYIQSV
jgi:hypothetical protein